MPPKKDILKLTSEVKTCVLRLSKCFNQELRCKKPVYSYESIAKRVAHALGINLRSVYKILADSSDNVQPSASVTRTSRGKVLDDFAADLLRRTVYEMYGKGEFASIKRLTKRMEEAGYRASATTIWRTLKAAGFKHYSKHGKRFLKENQDIVAARHAYLRKIKKYREEGLEIVYLDETWINANHNAPGEWSQNRKGPISVLYPDVPESARCIPCGKGQRLIVLDAGSSRTGFIPDVGLAFTSKTNSQDYHDEMNGNHFIEWFEHVLIPAIDHTAVIVMDNAPYHNIKTTGSWYPRTSTNKAEVRMWLEERGLNVEEGITKAELMQLVKINRPPQVFLTDHIANENGHEVLRLPVRHCELNPIELIQAQEKQKVSHRNSTFKLKDVTRLYLEAKLEITVVDWAKAEAHVIRDVEEKLWDLDGVRDEEVASVVIEIDDDSDSEEITDSESSDDDEALFFGPVSTGAPDLEVGPGGDACSVDEADDGLCAICNINEPPTSVKKPKHLHTPWAECSICDRWVHIECSVDRKINLNDIDIANCFVCKICSSVLKCSF